MKSGKTYQWLNSKCAETTIYHADLYCPLVSLKYPQLCLQPYVVSCLGLRCIIKLPQLNEYHVLAEPK